MAQVYGSSPDEDSVVDDFSEDEEDEPELTPPRREATLPPTPQATNNNNNRRVDFSRLTSDRNALGSATKVAPPTKGISIKSIGDFLKPEANLYHGFNKEEMTIREDGAETIWRKLDRTQVHIKHMDNSHLYNCIRFLAAKKQRSQMLEKELEFRLQQWRKDNGLVEDDKTDKVVLRKLIRS